MHCDARVSWSLSKSFYNTLLWVRRNANFWTQLSLRNTGWTVLGCCLSQHLLPVSSWWMLVEQGEGMGSICRKAPPWSVLFWSFYLHGLLLRRPSITLNRWCTGTFWPCYPQSPTPHRKGRMWQQICHLLPLKPPQCWCYYHCARSFCFTWDAQKSQSTSKTALLSSYRGRDFLTSFNSAFPHGRKSYWYSNFNFCLRKCNPAAPLGSMLHNSHLVGIYGHQKQYLSCSQMKNKSMGRS